MAIPKKPPPNPVHNSPPARLAKFLVDSVASIPYVLKQIPHLPKLKLLKYTGFFLCTSGMVFLFTGPFRQYRYRKHVNDAEILYSRANIRDSSSMTGTEKPYSDKHMSYDFKEEIDNRAKSENS
eukprot:TRINITY_DN22308_c0_g1_i1.p1 TRINITY_DN22308_c0_g1~~TRINITY_DN22308_c0_g1_i1.p1  ORF type:complete len:124 (+),score=0.80 TRINITY_DN22308_c0_g1_i1:31-402(+)